MSCKPIVKEKKYFLHPSAIFASKEPTVVSTILGTCVAVCMYDTVLHIGGVNHYIMPWYQEEGRQLGKILSDKSSHTKFGNIAIDKLLQKMLALGAKHEHLQAKIFGGMSRTHANMFHIGERNAEVASLYLKHLDIPVLVQHVGGQYARKLIFHTHSGEVRMKLLLHSPAVQ
ncbi:chemotaxis protein CheD [Catalinimonas niigatensis]|uniref:chemotaxis protein CheD n=1 Tax=Catalinimonas niigatensis TaxID=1397264 RepID=UPI002666FF30|nr:chemotaxis protein CheD [Catalinimonas niigatensis]WPP53532.1 chemotaxis protein CheD [Catalinimonas niigatensis]